MRWQFLPIRPRLAIHPKNDISMTGASMPCALSLPVTWLQQGRRSHPRRSRPCETLDVMR